KETFSGCLHLVNAWAVENRLILGARSVPEGGHEITTIPDLLGALDRTGGAVTIDAAGCQKSIVEQIRQHGGDYVVCVKGSRRSLRDRVADVFEWGGGAELVGCGMAGEVGEGRGRVEERYVTVPRDPGGSPGGRTDV